jgi:hypothetical protein
MTKADRGLLMLALRAWLDEDERNARRVVEVIYAKALAGHFGYFRFLIDTVDGPIRPTAEEEGTFEAACVIVIADDGQDVETAKAA